MENPGEFHLQPDGLHPVPGPLPSHQGREGRKNPDTTATAAGRRAPRTARTPENRRVETPIRLAQRHTPRTNTLLPPRSPHTRHVAQTQIRQRSPLVWEVPVPDLHMDSAPPQRSARRPRLFHFRRAHQIQLHHVQELHRRKYNPAPAVLGRSGQVANMPQHHYVRRPRGRQARRPDHQTLARMTKVEVRSTTGCLCEPCFTGHNGDTRRQGKNRAVRKLSGRPHGDEHSP